MREASGRRARAAALGLATLLATLLATAGCLVAERQEERFVLHPELSRGEYTVTLTNVQSDGPTPHHQQQDFDFLVKLLTSDEYLMDRMRGGVYVKQRSVTIEDGTLMARETGLFSDITDVGMKFTPIGAIVRPLTADQKLLSTNGRLVREGDSLFVRWVKGTREMTLVTADSSWKSSASLVEKFRAWKAANP